MGRIIRNGIEYGSGNENATNINYDGAVSGLEATTVQAAVDEVAAGLEWKKISIPQPTVTELTTCYERKYAIDLSNYKELEITLLASNYGTIDKRIVTLNEVLDFDKNIYVVSVKDENSYEWICCVKMGSDNKSIFVRTAKTSTKPTEYPMIISNIFAK